MGATSCSAAAQKQKFPAQWFHRKIGRDAERHDLKVADQFQTLSSLCGCSIWHKHKLKQPVFLLCKNSLALQNRLRDSLALQNRLSLALQNSDTVLLCKTDTGTQSCFEIQTQSLALQKRQSCFAKNRCEVLRCKTTDKKSIYACDLSAWH